MDIPVKAPPTPVFFVAGGTGISAETLGNMMLQQFPSVRFVREKLPFIKTAEQAREAVAQMDAAKTSEVTPLVFSTVAVEEIREILSSTDCAFIDLFGSHLDMVEQVLHVNAAHNSTSAHGVRDEGQYDARMKAVEFAIEHDDGQSLRQLDRADLILTAPSRCGKTPTTMYLALQYGLRVANYPLVEEDFESSDLPRPIKPYADKCFGLLSTPARLSQVRSERRPGSAYATLAQCTYELRRAEALFRTHRIPYINSANMSVEEMAAMIMQTRKLSAAR
ncbi:pyruvate, water dikinase regulatory protein [Flexivirga meconopsidis]|uniref:pyruvate, water dikinase regulatory protein n=1 Tax=Flexivirga meconopsidis TaxID=2977121 RepID=UPI003CC6776E